MKPNKGAFFWFHSFFLRRFAWMHPNKILMHMIYLFLTAFYRPRPDEFSAMSLSGFFTRLGMIRISLLFHSRAPCIFFASSVFFFLDPTCLRTSGPFPCSSPQGDSLGRRGGGCLLPGTLRSPPSCRESSSCKQSLRPLSTSWRRRRGVDFSFSPEKFSPPESCQGEEGGCRGVLADRSCISVLIGPLGGCLGSLYDQTREVTASLLNRPEGSSVHWAIPRPPSGMKRYCVINTSACPRVPSHRMAVGIAAFF